MRYDAIWQAFADSGDPMMYLLYRAVEDGAGQIEKSGDSPAV